MSLVKALVIIDPRDIGGKFPPVFSVQFNPAELALSKGAQMAEIAVPGLDAPILQFVRGQSEKMSVELVFDTAATGGVSAGAQDVRNLTEPFYQLVKIQSNTHAPPRIRLVWGVGMMFSAVVESVQRKFTLFTPEGVPVRATLTVGFVEYKDLTEQLRDLNLQSSDHTKRRLPRRGERLDQIAYEEYGDPAEWRRIAESNPGSLTSRLEPRPGVELVLPPAEPFRAIKRSPR